MRLGRTSSNQLRRGKRVGVELIIPSDQRTVNTVDEEHWTTWDRHNIDQKLASLLWSFELRPALTKTHDGIATIVWKSGGGLDWQTEHPSRDYLSRSSATSHSLWRRHVEMSLQAFENNWQVTICRISVWYRVLFNVSMWLNTKSCRFYIQIGLSIIWLWRGAGENCNHQGVSVTTDACSCRTWSIKRSALMPVLNSF